MTKLMKTLLATASLSAVLATAPAQAANVACSVDSGLSACFSGAAFGGDATVSNWNIGSITLGQGLWDLAGFFGARGATDLSLSLVGANTVNSTSTSFSNVAGGTYAVNLSGTFTPGAAWIPGQSLATYGGGFDIKSAVPEPQTYALLLAGLMAVGYVARRRKAD